MGHPKRKKVPWDKWKYQSTQTRASDTFFHGCGERLYCIPYTLDFALKDSQRQANHYIQCNPDNCTMYDDYCYEMDFLYYRKFTPPPIRPVNKNYALVMGRWNGIQGPYEFHEWKSYSWSLWDLFCELKDDENAIIEDNLHYRWSKIYFRHPKDFVGGHYSLYSDILMVLCAYFEDEYTRHRAYADVWEGSCLFENIEPVDKDEARDFRQSGKIFNFTVPHKSNCKKRGVDPHSLSLSQLREDDRLAVKRFKNRIQQGDTALTTYTDPVGVPFHSWYKLAKHIPLRLKDGQVKPAIFDNNEELIQTYWKESLDTIQGFFDCHCIELMPENYIPDLSGNY